MTKTPRLIERVGGASLSEKARTAILNSIVAGRFDGGRLPPEGELAGLLGVSRTTVRSALQALKHDGVLTRTPRIGTVVRAHASPSVLALQQLVGFSGMLTQTGHTPSVTMSWRQSGAPPMDAVKALKIERGTECILIHKVFKADGKSAIALVDVFPTRVFRHLPQQGMEIPDSAFEFSEEFFTDPIDHAVAEIIPSKFSNHHSGEIGLKRGDPYILLRETHYSRDDRPIGFSRIHVSDRFVRFRVVRRRI